MPPALISQRPWEWLNSPIPGEPLSSFGHDLDPHLYQQLNQRSRSKRVYVRSMTFLQPQTFSLNFGSLYSPAVCSFPSGNHL